MTDQEIMNEFVAQSQEIIRLKDQLSALVGAAEHYMSQIGQGYQAHNLPFSKAQEKANTNLRAVLSQIKESGNGC